MEAAARRLLAEWDERIARKKAAEGLNNASAQIRDQPLSPAENADGERDLGSGSLDRRPQSTDAGGECAGLVAGGVSGWLE